MRQLSHHATILPVVNPEESLCYYTDLLGFRCTFKWENPVSYAVIKKDEISIHLVKTDHNIQVSRHPQAYIFCFNVDQIYEELNEEGVSFLEPLHITNYKMKEFSVQDPDGHILIFGQEIS